MGCFHSRESVYEQKGAPPKQEETVQHLPPIHNGPVLSLSRSAPGATQFISGSEDKVSKPRFYQHCRQSYCTIGVRKK